MNKKWRILLVVFLSLVFVSSLISLYIYRYKNPLLRTRFEPFIILSDNDFENYSFPGCGTSSRPYIIDNYNISTTSDYAISINSTSKYFIIRNCHLTASKSGIFISNVTLNTAKIFDNFCLQNPDYGILIDSAPGVILTENICINKEIDILVINSSFASLSNNFCSSGSFGSSGTLASICLLNSTHVTLSNNYCIGILLQGVSHSLLFNNTSIERFAGIFLFASSNNSLIHNSCSNNLYGILFVYSSNCTIHHNTIALNRDCGIICQYNSNFNLFYHNNFIDNDLESGAQAYDICSNNLWYNATITEGNYWSDWTGVGPYLIGGSSNSTDLYPLTHPLVF